MNEIKSRKLPVGMQSFSEIREGGYIYVDKTDLVWQIVNEGSLKISSKKDTLEKVLVT